MTTTTTTTTTTTSNNNSTNKYNKKKNDRYCGTVGLSIVMRICVENMIHQVVVKAEQISLMLGYHVYRYIYIYIYTCTVYLSISCFVF